jgi:hypothetical protein
MSAAARSQQSRHGRVSARARLGVSVARRQRCRVRRRCQAQSSGRGGGAATIDTGVIQGDLQIVHVLDGNEASGVGDWSEGGQGDAMYDLATLTLAHEEHPTMSWRATGATSRST